MEYNLLLCQRLLTSDITKHFVTVLHCDQIKIYDLFKSSPLSMIEFYKQSRSEDSLDNINVSLIFLFYLSKFLYYI